MNLNLTSKIAIFVGGVLLFIMGSVIIWKQFQISTRQDAIEQQVVAQKELAEGITRAMAQYATKKDIEDFAKESNVNLKLIKDDLDKLNASVTAINHVVVVSKPQTGTNVPSTGTTPGENPPAIPPTGMYHDPYGYQQNVQKLTLNEQFLGTTDTVASVPFGEVGFSAWKDKPWSYNVSSREYKVTTVLGTDENQRQYAYNKFAIAVNGKEHAVAINSSTFKQEYPMPKFSFFNPRLYLGVDAGVNVVKMRGEVSPNVSVQLMSYGRYKTQPDLSILQVGVGYGIDTKLPNVSLAPVMYNVGKHLPLMNNLYVGPSVHVNTSGDVGIMGGIRVGL